MRSRLVTSLSPSLRREAEIVQSNIEVISFTLLKEKSPGS